MLLVVVSVGVVTESSAEDVEVSVDELGPVPVDAFDDEFADFTDEPAADFCMAFNLSNGR